MEANPEGVTEARRAVGKYAERAGCDRGAVELAVAEAVANAVIHGYPEGSPGKVTIRATAESGALAVEVSDDGAGMRGNPDSLGLGLGLGLPLIARVTDEFTITTARSGGAMVSMRFRTAA